MEQDDLDSIFCSIRSFVPVYKRDYLIFIVRNVKSIMIKTGGFWDDTMSPRDNCYSVVPRNLAAGQMIVHGFEKVYQALGNLGYRFRDAGHDSRHVVVSLDRKIDPKHLEQLERSLSIEADSGDEL